jgi:uncharacterized protein YndB with AHSA1/START domain
MTTGAETALRLECSFDATPEAVFDAWVNPEVLRRWWAAGPDWETPSAEVDLRPGGRYRRGTRDPAPGASRVHVGLGEHGRRRVARAVDFQPGGAGPSDT